MKHIVIEHHMSLDGARAAQRELRVFLDQATDRMIANRPTRRTNRATTSYVVLRGLLEKINRAVEAEERRLKRIRQMNQPEPPTVREVRGR